MINKRVFVNKKSDFDIISKKYLEDLNNNLHLNLKSLKVYSVYDLFDVDEVTSELIVEKVLSDKVTDEIHYELNLKDKSFIAYRLLPGQFDVRVYNAISSLSLITKVEDDFSLEYCELIVFDEVVSNETMDKIKKYIINPVEKCEKDLLKLEKTKRAKIDEILDIKNFRDYSEKEILEVKDKLGINLDLETLLFIRDYYKKNNYDAKQTELYIFDTYWSDHCRHTTFNTVIENVEFDNSLNSKYIKKSYEKLLKQRQEINHKKDLTLMDIATFNARYLKKKGLLKNVEESEEINASSVYVDISGEKYLVMFKNETHNHPTEIEPFGGASTCLGGAIRDPLSGRSYVYQGIRITGSADPTKDIKDTLKNKLPQRKICQDSAKGFSSYGNQIGMATTYVNEIYHPSYVAKRLEIGAVVGIAKAENVIRKSPTKGDLVLLLGGKTGKDGIGGASGSSLSHNKDSIDTSLAQIQKGNPLEERKLQRLFKNGQFSKLIKKCNDFGAGGVSVAIGELADGVTINLDKVPLKTDNINYSQIAISESQERMAIVIDKNDLDEILLLSESENVEASIVGVITDDDKLVMKYKDEVVASIDRDFLDTNGIEYYQDVFVKQTEYKDYDRDEYKKLNTSSKKGLIEIFDSSVGQSTLLSPLGGKNQITEQLGSVSLIHSDEIINEATVVTYGFNPTISENSPYFAGLYAVIESVSKQIALGSNLENIYISMQEYFPSLKKDEEKWGLVFSALLGAYEAMDNLKIGAIGGKDSMSGTFEDIDVISTIVSFAFSVTDKNKVISRELKKENSNIYFIPMKTDENGYPDFENLKENYLKIVEIRKNILSISTVSDGINNTLLQMSYGNDIGFEINTDFDLEKEFFGSFIFETTEELNIDGVYKIGSTKENLTNTQEKSKEEYLNTLKNVYPYTENTVVSEEYKKVSNEKVYYKERISKPKALIICFSGTNSEFDMEKSFKRNGADTEILVINNSDDKKTNESISKFCEKLESSHILVFPGGFSFSDEPDGSGKFIANFLRNEKVKDSVHKFLEEKKLILGICNGFQGLIKSGLVPYGKIIEPFDNSPTLYFNDNFKHISKLVKTSVVSNRSPWLQDVCMDKEYLLPISHGEGKFIADEDTMKYLIDNDLIATRYGNNGETENPNGSVFEIEGITSICGQVFGKMAHNERSRNDLFINTYGEKEQNIFASSVNYFTGGSKNDR